MPDQSFSSDSALIVRPGALGDAILTLPVLQTLRAAGVRRIVVLGTPGYWQWLRANGNGVTIADWGSADWLGLVSPEVALSPAARRQLKGLQSALVYLRSGAAETASVLSRSGFCEVLVGAPPVWPEHPDDARDDRHAAERLLAPLRERLGGPPCFLHERGLDQTDEPWLTVSAEERDAALRRLGLDAPPAGGFFAVHPGSGGLSKCWPAERYVELLRRAVGQTPAVPLLFLGPAEEATLQHRLRDVPAEVRWARSFPLREVLALLTLARVFIGNDAGVTHLAARCCPTVQLFGATRPSCWKALGRNVTTVQAPDGKLDQLPVDVVWRAVRPEAWGLRLQTTQS